MKSKNVEKTYQLACERYAEYGVDCEKALRRLRPLSISLHCWQGDDVAGFERSGALDGGLAVTGNYPGRARTPDELRQDLDLAYKLIPGRHRLNLHAIYAETNGRKVDRNELQPEHFAAWMGWAKARKLGLDFNGTFFSHPKAASGFTLSSADEGIRRFWVEHGIACRRIGATMGQKMGKPCVTNVWIPDGMKDTAIDKKRPRETLKRSLDEIFSEEIDRALLRDAVEGKLFGIGSESYVVGSHDFYLGYAVANNVLLCLDAGHFHPTEVISDKLSAMLTNLDEVLLHVSRGVRWDSDHVVVLSDELKAIAEELVRGDYLDRVHIGLDYFDASINRVAAWVIGSRNMLKALLMALVEPISLLREMEIKGDYTSRLALAEEVKTLPFGAIWDYHCLKAGVPVGDGWLSDVKGYEKTVLSKRR